MATLRLQTVALAVLLLRLAPETPTSAQQLPGCPDKCGDISIPYPFGIGTGCALDSGFELECNHTYSPPGLIVSTHRQQLTGLSLADGEAIALLNAKRECHNSADQDFNKNDENTASIMNLTGSTTYRFSAARNRFVALGCPNLGYFIDSTECYVSGCTSVCRPAHWGSVKPGLCTGVGCCQSKIPPNIDLFEPYMLSFNRGERYTKFYDNTTTCRYVFLVEDKWIEKTYRDHVDFNRTDDFAVPVVLDWAVRSVGNCSAARHNTTGYACRGAHSECFDISDGEGYRCRCSKGYQGNPYLDGGCTEIYQEIILANALLKPAEMPLRRMVAVKRTGSR
ncbi:hypothetical protein ABZP36_032923 [Zizania latifolia]